MSTSAEQPTAQPADTAEPSTTSHAGDERPPTTPRPHASPPPSSPSGGDSRNDADAGYGESPLSQSNTSVGSINGSGNTFNIGWAGAQPNDERTTATGPIPVEEVTDRLGDYVARPIDQELSSLLENVRCVILSAPHGTGRRTAAFEALAAVVEPDTLVYLAVPAGQTIDEKAIERGHGYIVDGAAITGPGTTFSPIELRRLARLLADRNSYLLVLGTERAAWATLDERHLFAWEPPTIAELIESIDLDPAPDIEDEAFITAVGSDPSVGQIVGLLRELRDARAEGIDDAEVYARKPESNRPRIKENLAACADLDQWILMAGLVFLSSIPQLDFFRALDLLDDRVDRLTRPTDGEDPTTANRRFTTALVDWLGRCEAHSTTRRIEEDDITIDVPVVDFAQTGATAIYFEEFWRVAPPHLRQPILDWLVELGGAADGMMAAVLAERIALLLAIDTAAGLEVVGDLAGTRHPVPNRMAAAVVDQLADQPRHAEVALEIAKQWASDERNIGLQYSALYVHTGTVGVLRPRRAVRVYRRQLMHRPAWTLSTWGGLSEHSSKTEATAHALIRQVARLRAVRDVHIHDPAFLMLDRWFGELADNPPVALQLARHPAARRELGRLLGVIYGCNAKYLRWLKVIVPWADCGDEEIERAAALLVFDVVRAVPEPKRTDVADWLVRRITKTRLRPDGPSPLAAERCLQAIQLALPNERTPDE